MPYASNSDLPESVRSRYSSHCQDVWRNVWNSVHEKTGDESRAFASANSQAQKCEGNKAMANVSTFKIFAPMLKASLDADGKRRLHGIASSTIRDRHGDTMALSALSDMERSASNNLTIFLNHEYKVPEDVAGYVERAMIRQHPQDGEIHDLVLDIVVNESNPRAVNAWEAIQNGTQLGLSIGAMIPDGGAIRDRKSGAYNIEHVELLETSLVGVPANPRSWVEYAVKSLGTLKEISEEEIEHIEDDGNEDLPAEEEAVEEFVEEAASEMVEETIVTEDMIPTITDATVNIKTPYADVSIDTGNRGSSKAPAGEPSQATLASEPESEDEDEDESLSPWAGILPTKSALIEEDMQAALQILEPTVVASLRSSSEILKAVAREHTELKAALAKRNDEYEEVVKMTEKVVANTAEILRKLSATPVGRRAVVREATEQFAGLSSVYSEEFLTLLKRS